MTRLKTTDLNLRDVYITPLGRRCQLKPQPTDRVQHDRFTFAYISLPGGFSLTGANVRILRREP